MVESIYDRFKLSREGMEAQPIKTNPVNHPIDPFCWKEICGMCWRGKSKTRKVQATHKVGSEDNWWELHNFTQYVCCKHFGQIMGPLAQEICEGRR